jgi:hypothetical protein
MPPGNGKPNLAQRFAVQVGQVTHGGRGRAHVGDAQGRVLGLSVGLHVGAGSADPLDQAPGPGVVGTDDDETGPVDQVTELGERGLQSGEVTVRVEVVGVDVGHDRRVRAVVQERPVALVGLGDEVLAGAVVRARADLGEFPADHKGRIAAAVLQHRGEHGGRRGLAVRTGDRDRAPASHRRGQRLGAVQHAQSPGPRLDQFQVVGRDRGRVDHGVDTVQVGR